MSKKIMMFIFLITLCYIITLTPPSCVAATFSDTTDFEMYDAGDRYTYQFTVSSPAKVYLYSNC